MNWKNNKKQGGHSKLSHVKEESVRGTKVEWGWGAKAENLQQSSRGGESFQGEAEEQRKRPVPRTSVEKKTACIQIFCA